MIILNIFKRVKIYLQKTLNNFIEQCLLFLAVLACSLGFFPVAFDLVERYILEYANKIMENQAPNDQNMRDMPERNADANADGDADAEEDMIVDELEDVDDFDGVDDIDGVDDFEGVDDDDDADDGDDDDEDDEDDDDMDEEIARDYIDIDNNFAGLQPYESGDSDNDCNMNANEDPDLKKLRDLVLRAPIYDLIYFGVKKMYQFKPYRLTKDVFLTKNVANAIPAARSGHRIIADSGNLYSLGGYNPRSAITAARNGRCMLFQELWCYNFATKRWRLVMTGDTMPNMPRELASNALVMYNNLLISYGGTGYPFGESCSNDCYVFSKRSEKPFLMRLPVTGELPTPLYGPAIVIHEDYLYTIGGTTGFDYSCDVFRLNLTTRQWENMYISRPEMRDDPEGRYRHEIIYDGKYVYVLGGGTSLNVYDLQRIPAFNLKTNRWQFFDTKPDRTVALEAAASAGEAPGENVGFPKPRKCFSCVQHTFDNGDIEAFISGGLQGDFSTYFDDVWKLNIRTMQWTLIRTAKLPKALYFHSAADNGNGMMYIFGGIEFDEREVRRRNRVYKMWMTIPKLSEICWEAITYYNDHLCTYNRNTLLSYGIPKRFVDRVEFVPKVRRHTTSGNSAEAPPSSMACTSL